MSSCISTESERIEHGPFDAYDTCELGSSRPEALGLALGFLTGGLGDLIEALGGAAEAGDAAATAAQAQAGATGGAATAELAVAPNSAVFWSGLGEDGAATAAKYASENSGMTLEQTLAQEGITEPTTAARWDALSEQFAENASGTVRAVLGNVSSSSTWARVELPILEANSNVTQIIQIDPTTGEQTVILSR
jgi:hypothetical protein